MQKELENLKKEIFTQLKEVKKEGEEISKEVLRDLEVKFLGRKGELSRVLRGIKDLSDQGKKEIGKLANEIKQEVQIEFRNIKNIFLGEGRDDEFIDVSLPGEEAQKGHLHPLTLVQNELIDLFRSMGFMILDGPELESDYYCFEALNIPAYHPARDMQDTFYIDAKNKDGEYDLVMRTQTSPVQVRGMQKYGAPIRCIVPGRTFRCEATDACHEHTFHQVEGLMVDKNISIANFKAVLAEMFSGIFKKDVKIRLRPGYFPFVEPGFETDISCTICEGVGCSSCKHSGWLEIGGSGMVHPNVLRAGNVDPDKFSGFAFGFGIERIAMMKYGIKDIRLFQGGDLRFLEQF